MPALEARLQLAGSGPEEASLRARAREYGIEGDVQFLGSVADVPALLDECSFTVLPSLSEGMPNAVLESLAQGRAVVASAVGGIPEILTGAGASSSRPETRKRLPSHAQPAGRPRPGRPLGAEGRALVGDGFGIDRMVEESLRLYTGCLAGRTRQTSRSRDPGG